MHEFDKDYGLEILAENTAKEITEEQLAKAK